MARTDTRIRKPTKKYLDLIRKFPLWPLKDDADLAQAIAVIDALTDRSNLATEEEYYLEVLGSLVERYEAEHDPLPILSGIEAIRYLLDENGLTQAQLAEQTDLPEATISEVLSGKRRISPKVRGILATRFKVSPALFV